MEGIVDGSAGCMQPGMEVGSCTVMAYLGHGALGESYSAIGESGQEDSVLRLLAFGKNEPGTLKKKIKSYANTYPGIRSKHLLPIRTADLEDFFLWIECGKSPFPTLSTEVSRRSVDEGPFSEKEVRRIAFQMLVALHTLHQAGGLHGSLKPSHCRLGDKLTVVLTDAGLYPLLSFPGGFGRKATLEDTIPDMPGFYANTQSLLETVAFSSPEVLSRGDFSVKSDLYSVAMVVWHLLTGLSRPEPRFHLPENLDDTWREWFCKGLANKPEERFRDAEEMLANLPGVKAAD